VRHGSGIRVFFALHIIDESRIFSLNLCLQMLKGRVSGIFRSVTCFILLFLIIKFLFLFIQYLFNKIDFLYNYRYIKRVRMLYLQFVFLICSSANKLWKHYQLCLAFNDYNVSSYLTCMLLLIFKLNIINLKSL
jgi:hypothetical protein